MKRFFFTTLIIFLFLVSPTFAAPPGGGAESFSELDDAPATYVGQSGKTVTVKVDETGLEFTVPPGGGDMLKATYDTDADDDIDLAHGGTGAALSDPNADRIMFWDDSAGAVTWLTLGNGFVFSTTTLNLDLTPTAGSATLQYNDDAIEVKYDATMFGESANGLILDVTPSSGFATLQVVNDAVVVKYDTALLDESADGLTIDITPSSGSASLQLLNDSLQVKYDSTLTVGASGLGVSNTLSNSNIAADAAISLSKLSSGTSAQIIVANGSGVPTYVAMSGDATLANTGAITIANNAVTGAKISLTSEATGALMTYNEGTGNWEVLLPGTAGYPLLSGGTGSVSSYSKITNAGITAKTVRAAEMEDNTITAAQIAATLTFSDGDLVDLSGITPSAGVDEGLILPTWANVTPASDKLFLTYDPASNSLKVYEGGWVTIAGGGVGGGAPTDATYLTVSLDGTLSNERTLSAGLGIGYSDGGENGAYSLTFASSELGDLTWGTGSAATQAWTFNGSGTTDPVLTAGDGYISVTTGELRESTRRVYSVGGTDVAVADGGTAKSSWTQYAIPYLSAATTFSEIPIGTAGYTLNVNGTTNGYTWTAPLTMDTITDGSSYQKVAAADVDASSHVNRFYDSDGTGYITVTGLSGASAKTFSDGAKTVMEVGENYGGLIFGDTYPPDAAGEIGYSTGVLAYYDGSASRTIVAELVATGGLILGDSTPDAAGEIGYASNVVSYYDGTSARTLMTLETAQNISGVKEVQDNINFNFGNDADWSVLYDETTNDQLLFTTAKIGAVSTSAAMFKILVNSGAGTLTDGQNVFEVMNNATSLFKVDENGNTTIPGSATFGSTSGDSYITMGGNTGGRSPSASAYEIYFDGGTDLSYNLNGTEKTVARLQDAQTFTGAKSFTGGIYSGDASTAASIRLYDGSSNYWTITSPAMSSNYTLTLPVDDGTSGQYLYTDGSGNTAWGTPTASAAGTTTGQIQINSGGTGGTLGYDVGLAFTGATDTLTIGETGAAGKVVLTDGTYNTTIQQGSQSTDAVLTLPIVDATISGVGLAETFSGIKTFSAAPVITAVNAASGSASAETLQGTLGIFNGSDTFRGLYLNYTNANHTGTSNTVALIDTAAISGDANSNLYGFRIGNLTGTTGAAGEVEYGISIGTGWDYGIYNSSLTYLGAATTFAGGSEDLTLTIGGSSNLAAFASSTSLDTLNFTGIALGSNTFQPQAIADASTVFRSGQTATNTVKVQAYDNDGAAYADIITVTAGNTPTLALAAAGGITVSNTTTFAAGVTLDDNSGASPDFTFQDATNETAVFSKVDAGYLTITTVAGDGVSVRTGNLTVGDGVSTQTLDGEDFYVNGLAEVDGILYADGGFISGGQNKLYSANADPTTTAGYILHDSTVTNHANGALRWHDGTNIRQLVDMVGTTAEGCTDTQVVAYNATSDLFYCKDDANSGSATAINAIGDAAADGTIGQTTYKQTWTSTLNSAGAVWTFTNTTADLTADVSFIDFKYTDDGDANGFFLRGYDNAGNDLKWSIAADGAATFGNITGTLQTAAQTNITSLGTLSSLTLGGNDIYIYFNETDGTDWYIGLDDTGNTLEFRTNATVGNSVVMELNEDGTGLSIGDAGDDDITLTFNANSNDGTIQWMEDEEEFRIASSGGESLYVDLDTGTANEIGINTGSSANKINFNAIALATTGTISGAVSQISSFASPLTTNPYSLTAANSYGTIIYYGATGEIDLPAAVAGMVIIVYNTGAYTITFDPNGTDVIVRDGTAQSAGVSITLSSGAGNYVTLVADAVNHWVTMGYKGTLAQGS